MGLSAGKKNLCPICSNPVPRFFATKIKDMPICKECSGKIDLPDGIVNRMSVEEFLQYLEFYNANQALRDIFFQTYQFGFGFAGEQILIDASNRLFRLKNTDRALVLEASNLKSFCILEDNMPLFEGADNALRCHQSNIPARVRSMASQIEKFTDFDIPVMLRQFYVELELEHPYWGSLRRELDAPVFDKNHMGVDSYLRDYQEKVDKLHELAVNLMKLINPDARELRVVTGGLSPRF